MLSATPRSAAEFNSAYLDLHVPKEDLYWTTYMGTDQRPGAFEAAELALKNYVSSPENLRKAREALAAAANGPESERIALQGWVDFFAANAVENPEARELQAKLIEAEAALSKGNSGRLTTGLGSRPNSIRRSKPLDRK